MRVSYFLVAMFHHPYLHVHMHTPTHTHRRLKMARLRWAPVMCKAPSACLLHGSYQSGETAAAFGAATFVAGGNSPLSALPANSFSRTVVNRCKAQTNRNQETEVEVDEKQVALAFGGSQNRVLPQGQGKIPTPSRNNASKPLHAGPSPFME